MKLVFFLTALAVLRSLRQAHAFNLTHWLFSFEYGPTKRGLAGEVLRLSACSFTENQLNAIFFLLFLLASLFLWVRFTDPAKRFPDQPGAGWFALLALCSSATLQRMAWDLGRFDVLGLILMAFGLWGLSRLRSRPLSVLLQILICVLMILIHEAQVFLFVPIFLLLSHLQKPESSKCEGWLSSGVFVLAVAFALFWSQYAVLAMEPDSYIAKLRLSGIPVDSLAARIPLRDLGGNLRYHYELTFRPMVLLHHTVFLLGTFPLLFLCYRIFREGLKNEGPLPWTLGHLTAISPLVLYLIGLDHFRWWAVAFTNLFLLWAAWIFTRPTSAKWLLPFFEKHRNWILGATISSFIFGSLGDFNSFGLWDWAVRRF